MRRYLGLGLVVLICAGQATAPATQKADKPDGVGQLVKKLNSLPKDLEYEENETAIRSQARGKWMREVAASRFEYGSFSGTIEEVHKIVDSKKEKLVVKIGFSDQTVWGLQSSVNCSATLENVTPEVAVDWKKGDAITVKGTPSKLEFRVKKERGSVFFVIEKAFK